MCRDVIHNVSIHHVVSRRGIGYAEKSTRKSKEKSKEKNLKNERMGEHILVDVISKELRRKGGFAPTAQGGGDFVRF